MATSFRQRLRDALIGVAVAAVAIPLAASLALLALPLWRWLETEFGIEAIGHSGPADWCYLSTYLLVLSLFAFGWRRLRKAP